MIEDGELIKINDKFILKSEAIRCKECGMFISYGINLCCLCRDIKNHQVEDEKFDEFSNDCDTYGVHIDNVTGI